MTPEKEKILSKVKKLLALAESPNEHEAALAAARAQELLLRHNLSMKDIKTETEVVVLDASKDAPIWKINLLFRVCKAFYCESFTKDTRSLIIIGSKADAEVALFTYKYLYDTVLRLTDAYSKSPSFRDRRGSLTSYCLGVVSSICETLQAMVAKNEQAPCAQSNTIVLMKTAKERQIADYLKERFEVGQTELPDMDITDMRAYSSGRADGRKVIIAKGGALA